MTESPPFLPYARHAIDDDDIAAVADVLRGDWLTTGPAVTEIEKSFCDAVNAKHAVVCSSGTAGLHLAMLAAGIRSGDWVVVPSMTFMATANAARYVGADVIFADCDPDTGLMTPDDLLQALDGARDRRVAAAVPVHLAGQCADLKVIAEIGRDNDCLIVEDACHALGSGFTTTDGHSTLIGDCTYSESAVFSLHPAKTIAMGEGGMVTTNSDQTAERLRDFRNHGMTRNASRFVNRELAFDDNGDANPWYYEVSDIGYNYRASDINCALGLSQIAKLEQFVERRRQLVHRYDQVLRPLSNLVSPMRKIDRCHPGWHLYVVHIDFEAAGISRAQVISKLREHGIGSQVNYIPLHHQPYYRDRYGPISLPGADQYYNSALSLPLFPTMTDSDIGRVADALAEILRLNSSL